ncbi:hydroxylamine reductase [Mesobacillus maritimus]|uniref:hydroxylamine reductase n=1 Tax=Mesobacillus maritimus TaxID=1643336 RepID=UPI002040BD13|nr:hydroxylamine reductase [Mesobacillus maritimus]MCM3585816.1 hydroxylamine reductase [Mesobacillus maritimus]MCM3670576.1 hydroxylamine reductase [Mesobacillus maritimus]
MSMFCHQCQEALKGIGCNAMAGVCGKTSVVANLQDLLIYTLKGVAEFNQQARKAGLNMAKTDRVIMDGLFSTITNANFDEDSISKRIESALAEREVIKQMLIAQNQYQDYPYPDYATWTGERASFIAKSEETQVGILGTENEDVRSLRSLILFGLKGMAAYAEHALNLGYKKDEISDFIEKALIATEDNSLTADDLVDLTMETGKFGVDVMALLDQANTTSYGHPEMTEVNIGVRNNPAILVSGHDLKDFEELLEQTAGTGVDVYTHSEMLPANYYPAFKKYDHFVGNYGNAWWKQKEEFESFNGPVLFTTNCIVPPKASYKDRIYTTGATGYPGFKHIPDRDKGGKKDFSEIIEHAKTLPAPTQIEEGTIIGGFAHNQVTQLADKVVDAVKTGAIKKFFVMAGCDGRMKSRDYYTNFAQTLPQDTVILTAGCAKYRYNKLPLGDIGGIPRVLDAGQCNDSYSLAVVAMKLKEIFELNDINELPIEYNLAWYEQKAVIVLLALLYLGVKDIKLGPTLPAFLSPNVAKVLVENFGISTISTVEEDMAALLA